MKVLVIGSGGREHAILWALRRTSKVPLELFCAPGNGGISEIAKCIPTSVENHTSLIESAWFHNFDLTIVGPEGPLAAGIVDDFARAGLKIVGPNKAASRLESSKVFAKEFMSRHQIPTADYVVPRSADEVESTLRSGRFGSAESSVVVKADGLAGGKGVVVARSHAEAERAVQDLTSGSLVPGEAAKQILIEEALEGREVSVLLFADGDNYALMPAARDHKRVGENDTGPNTGGMGAITDGSVLKPETLDRIVKEVIEPTLKGAREEGFPFRGVLFVGLMLTAAGPKVLEYNVRFGDPETQAILVRLESDLFQIFQSIAEGTLGTTRVEWSGRSSACVVLASGGYPAAYATGFPIAGLRSFYASNDDPDLQFFHSGTSMASDGSFLTAGGRVLGVTARRETLKAALDDCYRAVGGISWEGMQFRRDIGRFNEDPAGT